MKPFLLLQLRPEDEAADEEYADVLKVGGLRPERLHRIRLDQQDLPADLDLSKFAGVIVGGGPGCVSDPADSKPPVEAKIEAEVMSLMPQITARDMPYLGLCYGHGVLAHHLGGPVSKDRYGEPVGAVDVTVTEAGRADPLLAGLPDRFRVLVGHKEAAQDVPPGAVTLLASAPCPIQMIRFGDNVYSTQFHPEADGQSFATRIRIYRDRGYFAPGDADALTAACLAERIDVAGLILRRFVAKYGDA